MKIRLAAPLQRDSVVDGEGIRTVIWTQGCPHHCIGCHNQKTWEFKTNILKSIEEILEDELDKVEEKCDGKNARIEQLESQESKSFWARFRNRR